MVDNVAFDEMRATFEITRTITRYARAADRGRAAELAAQFAPDGMLSIRGRTFDAGEYAGRVAIVDRIERSIRDLASTGEAPVLRHHVSTIAIDFVDAEHARSSAYFLAVTAAGPDHWGRYSDRLVHTDEGWRFQHRAVNHEGFRPGSWIEGALDRLERSTTS
jgi:hypothetical protein